MNTSDLIAFINECRTTNKMWRFYKCKEWLQLRQEVLEDEHYECINCRDKYGVITRATTVHHVNHVLNRPDLALSRYYIDDEGNEQLNLMPLCGRCHNEVHPEKANKIKSYNKHKPLNDEKW